MRCLPPGGPAAQQDDGTLGIGRTGAFSPGPANRPERGKVRPTRTYSGKRSHHPCPRVPTHSSHTARPTRSATSRSPSATIRPPDYERSSPSTRPPSGPVSGVPGSIRMPPSTRPSPTCSTCPAGWPTRTRSPASTTAAARRSSSATLAATRPRSCSAHTDASWRASAAATSRPPTSAPTSPTWTSSRRPPGSPRAGPRREAGRETRRCSPHTASSRVCVRPPSTAGGRRPCPVAASGSPASARSVAGWSSC